MKVVAGVTRFDTHVEIRVKIVLREQGRLAIAYIFLRLAIAYLFFLGGEVAATAQAAKRGFGSHHPSR